MTEEQTLMLIGAANTYYKFNSENRFYHNLQHAIDVSTHCYRLTNLQPSPELRLAAAWHDAIYIPGVTNGLNEEASAQVLFYAARKHQAPVRSFNTRMIVLDAMHLIERTKIANHLSLDTGEEDLHILLDADLASLGTENYEEFKLNQVNIIKENLSDPESSETKEASAAFLSQFLRKERGGPIYRTAMGRAMWEGHAVQNIQRWCVENGVTYE